MSFNVTNSKRIIQFHISSKSSDSSTSSNLTISGTLLGATFRSSDKE